MYIRNKHSFLSDLVSHFAAGSSSPYKCSPFKAAAQKFCPHSLSRNFLGRFYLLFFVLYFIFSQLSANAYVNSLSGIDVKQSGNNYDVMLKLDKFSGIKKINTEQNNLTIMLDNTVPSDSVEIIYDNAKDLDNITVQKKNKNNTIVLLQGNNIENARIYTKELSGGTVHRADVKPDIIYIADKNVVLVSLLGLFIIFSILLNLRPQSKRYSSNSVKNAHTKSIKKIKSFTLRNKTNTQSATIPSISYSVNGSFNSTVMSIPKDFISDNYYNEENERIRKAG